MPSIQRQSGLTDRTRNDQKVRVPTNQGMIDRLSARTTNTNVISASLSGTCFAQPQATAGISESYGGFDWSYLNSDRQGSMKHGEIIVIVYVAALKDGYVWKISKACRTYLLVWVVLGG